MFHMHHSYRLKVILPDIFNVPVLFIDLSQVRHGILHLRLNVDVQFSILEHFGVQVLDRMPKLYWVQLQP